MFLIKFLCAVLLSVAINVQIGAFTVTNNSSLTLIIVNDTYPGRKKDIACTVIPGQTITDIGTAFNVSSGTSSPRILWGTFFKLKTADTVVFENNLENPEIQLVAYINGVHYLEHKYCCCYRQPAVHYEPLFEELFKSVT